MAKKISSCYNCVFAYLDPEITLWCYTTGFLNWPACANHPQSYGRMKRTPRCGICPNYRPKPETPEGDVRQIALGDGFTAYVDAAHYEWLSRWIWSLHGGYVARWEKGKLILMHREIMKPPKGKIVDHKNRNKLDNTRDNLQNTTYRENARNQPKRRGSSSQFWGVSYIKTRRKYRAYVYNGERCSCGEFKHEIEAARAHDAKAVELFGEFARLNFPEEWPQERRDTVAREKAQGRKNTRSTTEARRTRSGKPQSRRRSVGATHASPSPGRRTKRKMNLTTETQRKRRKRSGVRKPE
jgi:hypothetical protein